MLDEPLSALDASLRETLRDELAILLREFDITAIFVTHDQDEAMAIADRVAVMSHGRVVQSGTPEDLYRNPTSPLLRDLLATRWPFAARQDGTTLYLKGGTLSLPADGMRDRQFLCALKMFGLLKAARFVEKWKP